MDRGSHNRPKHKCQLVRIRKVEGSSNRGEGMVKFKTGNKAFWEKAQGMTGPRRRRSAEGRPKVQGHKAHAARGQSPAHRALRGPGRCW